MTKSPTNRLSFGEALKSASGSDMFLKLDDGATEKVVFVGDVIPYLAAWRGNRYVPWREEYRSEGAYPRRRFAFSVILPDKMRAKIWDITRQQFDQLGQDLEGKFEEVAVTIKQVGRRGDPACRFEVVSVKELTGIESDTLDTLARPNVEEIYAEFITEAKR
jgi:hypothetical protein